MEVYEKILLIYAVAVFIGFLAYIVARYGVLKSISDLYYETGEKLYFMFFIWSLAFPLIIVQFTPLKFFAGIFLAFCGATPAFRRELDERVHVIGAVGGIVLGFASLVIDFQQYLITILMIAFTLYAGLTDMKNRTWWVETAAFVLIIVGLLISKLQL